MPFGGAGAALADVTVATVANPTPVSFYAGRLAWSAFDPAHNGYVLMTHAGGITSPVAVRPRGVPFDVDLGPDEQGDTVAVYSRCGQEPKSTGRTGIPSWRTGRGCDIFKFTFATGRETRIASANGARSSEFLPSIWDTRLAFARVYERRKGKAGDRAYLYARRGRGGQFAPVAARPALVRGLCVFPQAGGGPGVGVDVEVGPTALDLRGGGLAFAGRRGANSCCHDHGAWLDTVGGGAERSPRPAPPISRPARSSPRRSPPASVYYVRSLAGRRRGDLRLDSPLPDQLAPPIRDVLAEERVILWSATDAGRTFYLLSGGSGPGCAADPASPGTAGPSCQLNELTP